MPHISQCWLLCLILPQPQPHFLHQGLNGKPRGLNADFCSTTKKTDAIPGITDSGYHTLDRAYELPQIC